MADKMMKIAGRDKFRRAKALSLSPDGQMQVQSYTKSEYSSQQINGVEGQSRVFTKPQESDGIEIYIESGSVRVRTDGQIATATTGEPLGSGFSKAWDVNLLSVYFVENAVVTIVVRGYTSGTVDNSNEVPGSAVLFYDNGFENVAWVEGNSQGGGSVSKESAYLSLIAEQSDGTAERTYVTDLNIDLTDYTNIFIEWENTGLDHAGNASYLIASTNKINGFSSYTERLDKISIFPRETASLNVAELTGNHFIRIHARDARTTATPAKSDLKVYRVWGVK